MAENCVGTLQILILERRIYGSLLDSSESSEFVRTARYTSELVFTGGKVWAANFPSRQSVCVNL
jgi:hypothetical protein